jgi:hypothetical protein
MIIGKKFDSGYLVPSHSCHAVLECIVAADKIWVYHNTPETKNTNVWWESPRSPRLQNLQVVTFTGKMMATGCSDHIGVLLADLVQQGTTVNVGSYSVTLLLLREAIVRKHVGHFAKGVLILHESTRPHSANATALPVGNLGTCGVQCRPSTECLTSVFC